MIAKIRESICWKRALTVEKEFRSFLFYPEGRKQHSVKICHHPTYPLSTICEDSTSQKFRELYKSGFTHKILGLHKSVFHRGQHRPVGYFFFQTKTAQIWFSSRNTRTRIFVLPENLLSLTVISEKHLLKVNTISLLSPIPAKVANVKKNTFKARGKKLYPAEVDEGDKGVSIYRFKRQTPIFQDRHLPGAGARLHRKRRRKEN